MTNRRVGVALGLVTAVLFYAVATATIGKSAVAPSGFSGFATGTNIHVDALQAPGGPRLVDTEVAFSAGVVDSDGLDLASPVNEMNVGLYPTDAEGASRVVAGDQSVARGSGLEIGVANDVPTEARDLVLAGEAGATAPPPESETREIATNPDSDPAGLPALRPLAYASLLRGQATANFAENPCSYTRANPLTTGIGYAADAQLLDTQPTAAPSADGRLVGPLLATDNPNEERSVTQSRSLIYTVPNGDGTYGLTSEVRETFAPIQIGRNNPQQPASSLTVELLGEWVFKATATGKTTGSAVTLGVEHTDGSAFLPEETIIRISTDGGLTYKQVLSFQDVFGPTVGPGGLVIDQLELLLSLAIGEDPRAIAAPDTNPNAASTPAVGATSASGAADAVRLTLLMDGTPVPAGAHAADLRIGHFEASVSVPAGGFSCPEPTTSTTPTTNVGPTTTTTAPTTTTTAPPTGYIEICNEVDARYGSVGGSFRYYFAGRSVTVPAGTCSAPIQVASGRTPVRQGARDGVAMTGCEVDPANRMLVCDPEDNRIVARVATGGVANETVVTFINRAASASTGSIKVCKIAGSGVAKGTEFTFNVGGRSVVVPAGPADQGGYCKILGGYNQGENVTITEAAKSGVHVSAIKVEPAGRKVSSSNANRTATVKPGPGYTVVSFTNAK